MSVRLRRTLGSALLDRNLFVGADAAKISKLQSGVHNNRKKWHKYLYFVSSIHTYTRRSHTYV